MNSFEQYIQENKGKTLWIKGGGGGGDVLSAVSVARYLERYGIKPILGGLTWKRSGQDPKHRLRSREEFENTGKGNDTAWFVTNKTVIKETAPKPPANRQHVEAVLAGYVPYPMVSVDVSKGVSETREGWTDFCEQHGIDGIITLDVGGDVLCLGDEPTVRSPICDQICLGAVSGMPNSLVAVAGFGSDGELSVEGLERRFATLPAGAYCGAITMDDEDLAYVRRIFGASSLSSMTESSLKLLEHTMRFTLEERRRFVALLNGTLQERTDFIRSCAQDPTREGIRSGIRTAEFGPLTATTMFFKPAELWRSNLFSTYIDEDDTVPEVNEKLLSHCVHTEISTAGN